MKKIFIFIISLILTASYIEVDAQIIERGGGGGKKEESSKPKKNNNSGSNNVKTNPTPAPKPDPRNNPDTYYSQIKDSWDRKKYEDFLSRHPNSQYSTEIRKRKEEIDLWENAQRANTSAAYRNYVNKTEYGRHIDEAQKKITELASQEKKNVNTGWARATRINTVEAYTEYVDLYPDSPYAEEAKKRIKSLDADNEWKSIRDSYDIASYRDFLWQHPDFSDRKTVENLITAEEALLQYKKGDLNNAYSTFSSLNDPSLLNDGRYSDAFKNSKEYHLYSSFNNNTNSKQLKEFLKEFPNSKYKDTVENMLALSIANNFDVYSGQHDYDEALSYAKDGDTRELIQTLIEENKARNKKSVMIRN